MAAIISLLAASNLAASIAPNEVFKDQKRTTRMLEIAHCNYATQIAPLLTYFDSTCQGIVGTALAGSSTTQETLCLCAMQPPAELVLALNCVGSEGSTTRSRKYTNSA